MNYKLFEKVTQNNNGKIVGLNINSLPQYQNDFKKLRQEFNELSELICPDTLETINVTNKWQNSGNFSKYFWNQYKPKNISEDKFEGYSIWIGINVDGIRIQCGTTQKFNGDRQLENRKIFNKIDSSVQDIFNNYGIYDAEVFKKFEKNNELNISYDKNAALFYEYKGNNEFPDTDYFKIILKFLSKEIEEYLKNHNYSYPNYKEEFKEWWFSDNIKQTNGNNYATGTKTSYFREIERLENVLNKDVFEIDKINELNIILNRLENEDLREYNRRHQNTDPSNGLKQYIKFIEYKQCLNKEETVNMKKYMKTKNIILYGSPGVGKTHNVNKLISMIENGKLEKDAFTAIQENSNETVFLDNDLKKRVKFITFHQSFGYEDFIEGFRPDEKGDIQLEDGIFKTIVDDASSNKKVVSNEHITFDEAYDIFRADFIDESLDILKTVTEKDVEICDFQDKFIKVKTKGAKNEHYVKKSDLDIVVDAFFNDILSRPADIKKLEVKKDTIALAGYYFPIASKIVDIIKNNKVDIESEKNFYLVIDEINRGNISKIFGELITLIEESKRDKLEIQLPYSKKPFSVPSNLYILGTMNSTDKSIALIDIALRRRFTFLKMKPSVELVPSFAQDIFTKINNQIVEDLGEDYSIGHSYFMNIDESELEFVLDFKIIPLLEEYYYGNNEGFEKVKNMIKGM